MKQANAPLILPSINGYDFSFRNSLNAKHPQSDLDPQLQMLIQTPQFNPPKKKLRMLDSQQTFGQRSRSHLQLTPIGNIGKIQINFNNFTTKNSHFVSSQLRKYSSERKQTARTEGRDTDRFTARPLTVEEIYVTRVRQKFLEKSREHLKTHDPPPVTLRLPEQILSHRRNLPRGREFNRKMMMQKRLQTSRLFLAKK